MSREQEILEQLKTIIDPDLGKDIVTLGFVKDLEISEAGDVRFNLELTTPACPVKEEFRTSCSEALAKLSWVSSVAVNMTAAAGRPGVAQAGGGLAKVKHIIGVASCKGGVGKSTVAVNLAFTLAGMDAAVGIFDADIYGPSLPTMVGADFEGLYQHENQIMPVETNGVKLMSFGYASANTGGGPAIMRGPMVTQVINQLLTGTGWGELDYLVIDMPPGTGDIQLTISQLVSMTAAIMVTTPQQISFVDVVKGIEMFDKVNIPTVAVIENMSYFECAQCGTRHELFGAGAMKQLVNQFGIANSFAIPLDADVSRLSDSGQPVVLAEPESVVTSIYREVAAATVREISKIVFGGESKPEVAFEPDQGILFTTGDGASAFIAPAVLRRNCRCANCINEMTGARTLKDEDVSDDIRPETIRSMGNYAVNVEWSDGHTSIYPYAMLEQLV